MNTSRNTSSSTSMSPKTKNIGSTSVKPSSSNTSALANFSFKGISLPELAVLGAAGFVIWKNRTKIGEILEENGITSPAILSGDFSDVIQSGVSMFSGKKDDATSTKGSSYRDA